MLTVEDLVLAYGPIPVVRQVSFQIQKGEVFAVLGANGAGKSSILRAISGLIRPISGQILFEGASLVGRRPYAIVRKGISQVPERRRIFSEMSVLDNLLTGATVHFRKKSRVRELLARAYELFPILKKRANQAGGTLSGGEQQQLAIARGMMADPRLLLVDEPTLGLAPTVIHAVAQAFSQLSNMGLTLLVAEQNADFALKVAVAGIVLSGGRVSIRGQSEALREADDVRRAYLGHPTSVCKT